MVEVDDVNVVIFDLDVRDDDGQRPHAAISESGWYVIVPMTIMAKVSNENFQNISLNKNPLTKKEKKMKISDKFWQKKWVEKFVKKKNYECQMGSMEK